MCIFSTLCVTKSKTGGRNSNCCGNQSCRSTMPIGYAGFLFLFASVLSNNHIFLEHPMSVLLPIGRTARITCRTNHEYGIQWIFLLQNPKATIVTDIDGTKMILRRNGIGVEGLSTPMSVITIQSSLPDDQIKLTCQAVQRQERLSSNIATVTYFGPPSPITNLTAIEVALATLRIVWSTDEIRTGIALNFTLTVISLKSQQMVEQLSGTDQERVVTVGNQPLCDLYSFEVLAVNAAGTSKPISIEHRFPSIPNITLLEQSLQHTLVKIENGVTLTVKFRSDISCPGYPVLNYTLVLQAEPNKRSLTFFEARRVIGDIVTVTAHLDANARFQYSIIAANRAGNTNESTPISIITTTVQSVSICHITNTSYFIQCTYLNGSIVRGCMYTLTSRLLGVENVTGMIRRNNTQGALVDLDIFLFDTLLAIEWQFDHLINVKERPIHVVGPSLSQSAPACTHDQMPESSDFLLSAGIAIGINLSFILIVVAVVAILIVICKFACRKRADDKELPIGNINNQQTIEDVMTANELQDQQNTTQNAVDSMLQTQQMEQIASTVVQQPKKKLEDLIFKACKLTSAHTVNKAVSDSEVFYDASDKIDIEPAPSIDDCKVKPEITKKDSNEVKKEKDQPAKKDKEQPAKKDKEQPAKNDIEQPAKKDKEQPAKKDKERSANQDKEQPAKNDIEQPAKKDKEQPAKKDKERPANQDKEQPAKKDKEQPAKKDKEQLAKKEEQSARPAVKEKEQSNKDDTKREVRSREKRQPHGTSLFSKQAHKNVKRVYFDDGTSGEVYPDYSNRGEIYPDRGRYRNEEYKQSGGPSSQDVYYDAWDGRHTPRGKEGKVYKSVSDHRESRKISNSKRLKQKTYSSRNCRVEVFDDFATEVSLPSYDRTDKILSDLQERARHTRRVEVPIDLDDFATEISLPTNDKSEKILEDLKKRALQIRRDRELKKANRRKVSVKKVQSSENRPYYVKLF